MRMAPWRYEGGREGGRVSRSREHRVGGRGSRTPSLMTNRSLTAISLSGRDRYKGRKSLSYSNRAATLRVSFRTLINIIQTRLVLHLIPTLKGRLLAAFL